MVVVVGYRLRLGIKCRCFALHAWPGMLTTAWEHRLGSEWCMISSSQQRAEAQIRTGLCGENTHHPLAWWSLSDAKQLCVP